MSRATSDDQLKFLLSCVRHSNNGKIDFVEVANECGVVSKGAAAKRYERLLKANGIRPNGGPAEKLLSSVPRQKSKADIAKSAAAKRRKLESSSFNFKVDDEDDIKPFFKLEPQDIAHIKHEPDSGFHPFAYQNMATAAPPPFFPRTPMPQMSMHSPYLPWYISSRQPVAHQFHPPSSGPSMIAQPTHHSDVNLSSSNQQQAPSKATQKSLSVSEEQIQSMFDEFCSQDMFKQPKLGHPPAQHTDTTSNAAAPVATESKLSPGTFDISTTAPPEIQVPATSTPDTTLVDLPMPALHEATGRGINDSILITD